MVAAVAVVVLRAACEKDSAWLACLSAKAVDCSAVVMAVEVATKVASNRKRLATVDSVAVVDHRTVADTEPSLVAESTAVAVVTPAEVAVLEEDTEPVAVEAVVV